MEFISLPIKKQKDENIKYIYNITVLSEDCRN